MRELSAREREAVAVCRRTVELLVAGQDGATRAEAFLRRKITQLVLEDERRELVAEIEEVLESLLLGEGVRAPCICCRAS